MLVAVMGDAARFPDGAAFKIYVGPTPRASETGETDRKGQPMSKAGNRDLRAQLIRSAETARRHDPQFAAVYHDQMVHRGAVHTKARASSRPSSPNAPGARRIAAPPTSCATSTGSRSAPSRRNRP